MDALYRLVYRLGHRTLRLWWRVRRPAMSSAAVALWHEERLLVVRTSYHPLLDLPGGGIDVGEAPLAAAVRELREETGIEVAPTSLTEEGVFRYLDLERRITAHVFAWRPQEAPVPTIDRREVVWAGLLTRGELADEAVSPLLRAYLGSAAVPPRDEADRYQCSKGTRQISRA